MNIETTKKEDEFIQAYIEAMYFTDTGDSGQPEAGSELCSEFKRESVIDCLSFYGRTACYLSDDEIVQAGHDFWLTRNGHGAGFWDGDWITYGDMFTKISECYGEVDSVFEDY